jgi:hypothetical protein
MGTLQDELEAVRARHGRLTAENLLGEARDPEHPLHPRFAWDDSVAAERWRLEQARQLIRSFRVRYTAGERPKTVRGYIAVPQADSPQHSYEPVGDVVEDSFKRKLVLQQMEREWRTLRARYEDFAEFADMVLRDVTRETA